GWRGWQGGVEALGEEASGELGVAPAGAHEFRQRTEHRAAELVARLEQRLGGRGEPDVPAIELRQRLVAGLELRPRVFRLAPGRVRRQLLLFEGRDAMPGDLRRLNGPDPRLRGR